MPGQGAQSFSFAEPLIFERGSSGRSGASLPARDVPEVDPKALYGAAARAEAPVLPEVSEPEAFRHYVRLSQQNFAIDIGMYPLGSCTMKYNPKVNEWAARLPGSEICIPTCRMSSFRVRSSSCGGSSGALPRSAGWTGSRCILQPAPRGSSRA
jgi:glycine cleavage system protein P-like pyridoxal-binding family